MTTDLFGVETKQPEPVAPGVKTRRKTVPKGYAAPPGSGPDGETCRSCRHYAHKGGGAKSYPACGLMASSWTNGPGTDIKAKSPACRRWEKPLTSELAPR